MSDNTMEIVDDRSNVETWRRDKRAPNQIRPPGSEKGLLHRADGSARINQGKTSVIASVFGPSDVDNRRELPDKAFVEVFVKPVSGVDGPLEREMEEAICGVLSHAIIRTMYPRTLISVTIQVLCNDGSLLSVAINAAIIALIDAGVALKSLVTSATCAYVPLPSAPSTFALILDPTIEEEAMAKTIFTIAYESTGEVSSSHLGVVMCKTSGIFSLDELHAATATSKQACGAFSKFAREVISHEK